jgi:hypothetical protein
MAFAGASSNVYEFVQATSCMRRAQTSSRACIGCISPSHTQLRQTLPGGDRWIAAIDCPDCPYTCCCCCCCCWHQGDTTIALREFQAAEKCQHHGRDNIAPLLAQAELLFDQGRVSDALQL